MKTTFIYALNDPRTGKCRYVGKSNSPKKRFSRHCKDAANPQTHKACWIAGLLKLGLLPVLEVLDEVPESQWKFWECEYLRVFRAIGFDLTNLAEGGEGGGVKGQRRSPEFRARISAWMVGNKNSAGFKHSDETRARMSVAMTGVKRSEETRKKLQATMTPEKVAKLSAASRAAKLGVSQSPEYIEKRIAPLRGRKQRPEVVEARAKRLRGRKQSEAALVNIRAAQQARRARERGEA